MCSQGWGTTAYIKPEPWGALSELWPSRTMQLPAVNVFFQPSIIQGLFFNGSEDKLWTLFWSNLIAVTAFSLTIYPLSQWENKPCCSFLCHDFQVYHARIQSGWQFSPDFIIRKKKGMLALQKNKSPAWVGEKNWKVSCVFIWLFCIAFSREILALTGRESVAGWKQSSCPKPSTAFFRKILAILTPRQNF